MDGREVNLDESFTACGLHYETEHFFVLIKNGLTESPVLTHDLSRRMIGMLDEASGIVRLKFNGE